VVEVAPVAENRHSGHVVTRLTAHVVCFTKHRYDVPVGDIKARRRDLLAQIRDAGDVRIQLMRPRQELQGEWPSSPPRLRKAWARDT